MLPLPGAWVGSLVEELRYCKKKKKRRERKRVKTQLMTFTMLSQQRGDIIYNTTGFTESI